MTEYAHNSMITITAPFNNMLTLKFKIQPNVSLPSLPAVDLLENNDSMGSKGHVCAL